MKLVILNFFLPDRRLRLHAVAADHSEGVDRRQHGQRRVPGGAAVCGHAGGIYVISLFSDRSGKRRLWVRFSLYSFAAALVASVVLREHGGGLYRAGDLRFLPQIGYQPVLVDAGAYRFAGSGR
jgi:hypothetical protein